MVWIYLSFITVLLITSISTFIVASKENRKLLRQMNEANYDKMSFSESLDLADLPVITFTHNSRKLNFLLDTGANKSIINTRELSSCNYTVLEDKNNLTGLDGITRLVDNVELTISYKGNSFIEILQSTDMSATFDNIKQSTGVSVHGILGNAFFQKYKYVLDFNELVAYSKADK